MNKISNWLIIPFIAIALLGFIDALYLSISHIQGTNLVCSILDGCDVVTNSQFSMWGPVPVAFAGMFYYLSVFFFAFLAYTTKKENIFKFTLLLTVFGFLFSLYFVYLQVFVINALCLYCIISATSSTLLFIFEIIIWKGLSKTNTN